MRVLFGLDATGYKSGDALDTALSAASIQHVRRIGHYAGKYEPLWIIASRDWDKVIDHNMPEDVIWQTITSCNKQYVQQHHADTSTTEYLGCVTSITLDEARKGGQYICDPRTHQFWTFKKENPNRPLGTIAGRNADLIVMDDIYDPADAYDTSDLDVSLREIMQATPTWPVDPRAPKFDGRAHYNPENWPTHPERG